MNRYTGKADPPLGSPEPPRHPVAEIRLASTSRLDSVVQAGYAVLRRSVVYVSYVVMIVLATTAGELYLSHTLKVSPTALAFALVAAYPVFLDLAWPARRPMRGLLAYVGIGFVGSSILWIALGASNVVWLAASVLAALCAAPGLSLELRTRMDPDPVLVNRAQFVGIGLIPVLYGVFLAAVGSAGPPLGVIEALKLMVFFAVLWFLVEPALEFRDIEDRLVAAGAVPLTIAQAQAIQDMPAMADVDSDSVLGIARDQRRSWRAFVLWTPLLLMFLLLFGGLDVTFLGITAISYGILAIGTFDFARLMRWRSGLTLHRVLRQQWSFALLIALVVGATNLVDLGMNAQDVPEVWIQRLTTLNLTWFAVLAGSLYGILQSASNYEIKPYFRRRAHHLSVAAAMVWLVSMALMITAHTALDSIPFLERNLGRLIALDLVSMVGLALALGILTFVCFSTKVRYDSPRSRRERARRARQVRAVSPQAHDRDEEVGDQAP